MTGGSADKFYESQEKMIATLKEQLQSISPDEIDKESTLKNAVNKQLQEVRKVVASAVRGAFPTNRHKLDQAVSVRKYKSIWGGNVNIYNGRGKAGAGVSILKNRVRHRYVSERTKQVESYVGKDRAFILRALEMGNREVRVAGSRGNKRGGSGSRGMLTARNFFADSAPKVTEAAQQQIERVIETIQKHNWDSYGK